MYHINRMCLHRVMDLTFQVTIFFAAVDCRDSLKSIKVSSSSLPVRAVPTVNCRRINVAMGNQSIIDRMKFKPAIGHLVLRICRFLTNN